RHINQRVPSVFCVLKRINVREEAVLMVVEGEPLALVRDKGEVLRVGPDRFSGLSSKGGRGYRDLDGFLYRILLEPVAWTQKLQSGQQVPVIVQIEWSTGSCLPHLLEPVYTKFFNVRFDACIV
ncbi:hypothetical protein ACLOJK_037249, partial [Asimina triloba]